MHCWRENKGASNVISVPFSPEGYRRHHHARSQWRKWRKQAGLAIMIASKLAVIVASWLETKNQGVRGGNKQRRRDKHRGWAWLRQAYKAGAMHNAGSAKASMAEVF